MNRKVNDDLTNAYLRIYKSVKSIANGFGLPVQDIEDALSDAYVSVSNVVSA